MQYHREAASLTAHLILMKEVKYTDDLVKYRMTSILSELQYIPDPFSVCYSVEFYLLCRLWE